MKKVIYLFSALSVLASCNSATDSLAKNNQPMVKGVAATVNGQPPLGTIITSLLPFDRLCQDLGESITYNRTTSTYAPCDRRSIQGSRLDLLTRGGGVQWAYAPDLRGVFLRGLNVFDPAVPNPQSEQMGDPEGANRQPGDFQADQVKHHRHQAFGILPDNVGISNRTRDADGGSEKWNIDPTTAKPRISVAVEENPGKESRPRNSAVYYYLRIN